MTIKSKGKITSVFSTKTSRTSEQRLHATSTLIDADNITVAFGDTDALRNVSLCVHEADFVGIIGPNGAGKTTLLRVLLGLQSVTAGTVSRGKARIGYVPQRGSASINSQVPISVAEVVNLAAVNNGQVASALQQVGMSSSTHKRFADLSGGQQQRVQIAKALAAQPNILILDEPTTGIDERSQTEFYTLLKTLKERGIAIIMVSHDVDSVLSLVSRVICLNQSIVYDGAPEHFEADKYMPQIYDRRHRVLHHQHRSDHA